MEARKAFIQLDTSRKVVKALQRNAAAEYSVGDVVIYRRDNVPGSTATVWSTVCRVIGREAGSAHWLLRENVPVLVMPPRTATCRLDGSCSSCAHRRAGFTGSALL